VQESDAVASQPTPFLVLIYRMPTKPTSGRVAVWRQLRKIGAIYVQQSVCVFPDFAAVRADLQPILARILESSGEYHLLPVRAVSLAEYQKLVDQFLEQTAKQYAEIIENCEVNFQKEVEFEIFRKNFTYEEAEEIRAELEKINIWFERVKSRDWFGAPNREETAAWIARSEQLLDDFESRVFAIHQASGDAQTGENQPTRSARPRTLRRPQDGKHASRSDGARARRPGRTRASTSKETVGASDRRLRSLIGDSL